MTPSLYSTRLSDWIRRDKDDLPGYNVYHPSQSTDRIGSSSDDLPGNRVNRPSPAASQSADLPGYVILRPSQAARVASRSSRATVDERKNDVVGRPIKTYYWGQKILFVVFLLLFSRHSNNLCTNTNILNLFKTTDQCNWLTYINPNWGGLVGHVPEIHGPINVVDTRAKYCHLLFGVFEQFCRFWIWSDTYRVKPLQNMVFNWTQQKHLIKLAAWICTGHQTSFLNFL